MKALIYLFILLIFIIMFVKPEIEEIHSLEEKKREKEKTDSKAIKTNLRRHNLKMVFVNMNGLSAGLRIPLFTYCKNDTRNCR